MAPGHHNLPCVGFRGEVVPAQDLVFEGREERLRSGVIEKHEPTLPIDCDTPSFGTAW
jgi:hypothetical protein